MVNPLDSGCVIWTQKLQEMIIFLLSPFLLRMLVEILRNHNTRINESCHNISIDSEAESRNVHRLFFSMNINDGHREEITGITGRQSNAKGPLNRYIAPMTNWHARCWWWLKGIIECTTDTQHFLGNHNTKWWLRNFLRQPLVRFDLNLNIQYW